MPDGPWVALIPLMSISLQFLGGVGTVTGSKFLVQTQNFRILVDCGLFQGVKDLRLQNRAQLPVDPATIDAVILTHAHLDHTGYLPLLVKNGFKGKIYATSPTRELSKVILTDSAHIQEEDAAYANEIGYSKHHPAEPLYTVKEVNQALSLFCNTEIAKWTPVAEKIKFRLSPSGHILGSVFIELKCEGITIVFSGDLGRSKPLILPPPASVAKADYLLIESTYGDRVHSAEPPVQQLKRIINETVARKGHVIVPSFAVGRAQDVLFLLSKLKRQKAIPDVPIFLDSPMGIHATEIFLNHKEWHSLKPHEVKDLCQNVTMVRNNTQSNEISRAKHSTIVIAGSGMISGGRVLKHLERRLPDERNTVVLVGFQAAGTRGSLLRDKIPELKMYGQYVQVNAKVEEISSLSAHADQKEILMWLKGFSKPPKKTFIIHGEPQASDALRVRIQDTLDWEVQIPKQFEIVNLS